MSYKNYYYLDLDEYLIFGDIAGRYNEFLKIKEKAPKNIPIISVGDIHDRGSQSNKLLDIFTSTKDYYLTQSNHTFKMLNFLKNGDINFLFWGGIETLESYEIKVSDYFKKLTFLVKNFYVEPSNEFKTYANILKEELREKITQDKITVLESSPLMIETKDLYITHAPIASEEYLYKIKHLDISNSFIENFVSYKGLALRQSKLQVHGHISNYKITLRDKKGIFGYNLDTTESGILTAMHWPSKNIYQETYE